ncbi:magnesium transporter [Oceanomicrobium pacificus]|uniref:Magnesium transporter MgtE n=1 Tax=Oceanomicrobium pacificus TaxID=2692916 RepID=A0A6B0TYP0_9RHOB|nr:magnesium transporter [Oceanomicrobium pacificus]MXU66123.1 magnesium transporter [Oceanomicrobium pacificus]
MSDEITPQEPEAEEDAFAPRAEVLAAIRAALDADDRAALNAALDDLHAADIADILEQAGPEDRRRFVALWGDDFDGEVLVELDERVRDEVTGLLANDVLVDAVKELDTDDQVYLVEDLDPPERDAVLSQLDAADRIALEQSLDYEEETAGRLMQRSVVTAPLHWTVGEVIDFMRASTDLPDDFYEVIIIDPAVHPIGTVALGRIMSHPRATPLSEIMNEDFRTLRVTDEQEDVAYAFNQYNLVSAPVVDGEGRLVGVITIDDAMEVLEDEAEEDMKLLAGIGDETLSDRVLSIAKARFPWLAVNMVNAIIAALVISQFEDNIQAIVALAVLMPIVASMGGNAGTQTLTVAVRALATRDLTSANASRIFMRETAVGLINGAGFAIIAGVVSFVWFGNPLLSVVLGVAMIVNMLVAGMFGILVPLVIEKAGADPALASGTFVTTVTDVVGFFSFLGLAGIVLL